MSLCEIKSSSFCGLYFSTLDHRVEAHHPTELLTVYNRLVAHSDPSITSQYEIQSLNTLKKGDTVSLASNGPKFGVEDNLNNVI